MYHGKTEFRGMHNGELLSLSPFQQQKFKVDAVSDLYPEYFILKVNDFNKWSKVPLEQWIYFLNTAEIPHDATAPGLDEARQKLQLNHMTRAEREDYYRHLDNVVILRDNIYTARGEGRLEGRAEGRAEGLAEGREKGLAEGREEGRAEGRAQGRSEALAGMARKMRQSGMEDSLIMQLTGLTADEIARL